MGEDEDVAVLEQLVTGEQGDHRINSSSYLLDCLATGTAVSEEIPTGASFSDLGCGEPFVVAVIHLRQQFRSLYAVAEAGQPARVERTA